MNISLIANNRDVSEKLLVRCVSNADLLVVFNHAYLLNQYESLKRHPRKYFMLRSNYKYAKKSNVACETYFGIDNINKFDWEKIFFIDGTKDWYQKASNGAGIHIQASDILEKYNIKMRRDPSVGFVGYLAINLWFPDSNITLVGWDISTIAKKYTWHDMEFEKMFYEKNNVKIMLDPKISML